STVTRKSVPVLSEYVMRFESGDHVGPPRKTWPSRVTRRASPLPSAGRTYSSYSPLASEKYAIHFPSGLQEGSRSAAALVRVRLRGVPLFAGAVQTSPRAPRRARFPV